MAVLTPRVLCCFYAGFYGTGGHSGEVIPVPFPNTEVKLPCADDTASRWESRSPPVPSFFLTLLRHRVPRAVVHFPSVYDKKSSKLD